MNRNLFIRFPPSLQGYKLKILIESYRIPMMVTGDKNYHGLCLHDNYDIFWYILTLSTSSSLNLNPRHFNTFCVPLKLSIPSLSWSYSWTINIYSIAFQIPDQKWPTWNRHWRSSNSSSLMPSSSWNSTFQSAFKVSELCPGNKIEPLHFMETFHF